MPEAGEWIKSTTENHPGEGAGEEIDQKKLRHSGLPQSGRPGTHERKLFQVFYGDAAQ